MFGWPKLYRSLTKSKFYSKNFAPTESKVVTACLCGWGGVGNWDLLTDDSGEGATWIPISVRTVSAPALPGPWIREESSFGQRLSLPFSLQESE